MIIYVAPQHELPEWDAEEVALFIESICNFPEYSRNFLINRVVGYSLCGLTVERIQKELNVVSSSHARNIVYAIRFASIHSCKIPHTYAFRLVARSGAVSAINSAHKDMSNT